MRVFEQQPAAGGLADDTAWAGQEARRRLGEHAAPEAWLALRARLGLGRLAEREPALRPWLTRAGGPGLLGGAGGAGGAGGGGVGGGPWRVTWLLLPLAAMLGLLGDALGSTRAINLLAPPLLALLAWNFAVYALMLGAALRRIGSLGRQGSHGTVGNEPVGLLRRRLLFWANLAQAKGQARMTRLLAGAAGGAAPSAAALSALARFGADWQRASQPLQVARLAARLHAAAACLALGTVGSLYARGLVFDYRAGWDSTFLHASAVHHLLGWVLGPAAALSGQVLPSAQALAGLRLATGGSESAAPWIHLWALTLVLAVVLPRLALAAWAAWQARRRATRLALPTDAAGTTSHDDANATNPSSPGDLQRLMRGATGQPLPVLVLPYSYALDAGRQAALARVLEANLGPGVLMQLMASLPMGAEDDLPRWLPTPATLASSPKRRPSSSPTSSPAATTVVALFALTATPERETHGAFVRALAAHFRGQAVLRVMVDTAGFRARFVGGDGALRLAQRQAAWQSLMQELGVLPLFIDLGTPLSGAQAAAMD